MNLYFHIWYSDGLKWLTDYIEPSDSLADHIFCWSDFVEEGQIPSTWLKFETHQMDCLDVSHGDCLLCGCFIPEMD